MKKILTALLTGMLLLSGCSSKEQQEEEPTYLATILIDPGHAALTKSGYPDGGATSPDETVVEADVNLKAAKLLGEYLETQNIKVEYTRDEVSELECNEYTLDGKTMYNDLEARANLSETVKADYFISLHCDRLEGSKETSGFHVKYHKDYKDSKSLAVKIVEQLKAAGYKTVNENGLDDEGGEYRVLRLNKTIGVLVEMGFLNEPDLSYLIDDAKLKELTEAIGKAIVEKVNEGRLEPTKLNPNYQKSE